MEKARGKRQEAKDEAKGMHARGKRQEARVRWIRSFKCLKLKILQT
jgi:hypothetical protein